MEGYLSYASSYDNTIIIKECDKKKHYVPHDVIAWTTDGNFAMDDPPKFS